LTRDSGRVEEVGQSGATEKWKDLSLRLQEMGRKQRDGSEPEDADVEGAAEGHGRRWKCPVPRRHQKHEGVKGLTVGRVVVEHGDEGRGINGQGRGRVVEELGVTRDLSEEVVRDDGTRTRRVLDRGEGE
jgi:hypothetical protein